MTLSDDGNWLWNGQAVGTRSWCSNDLIIRHQNRSSSLKFALCLPTFESIKDSDGDGYGFDIDEFDSDPNEWFDSDSDGLGNNQDDCPLEFGDSTIRSSWMSRS